MAAVSLDIDLDTLLDLADDSRPLFEAVVILLALALAIVIIWTAIDCGARGAIRTRRSPVGRLLRGREP